MEKGSGLEPLDSMASTADAPYAGFNFDDGDVENGCDESSDEGEGDETEAVRRDDAGENEEVEQQKKQTPRGMRPWRKRYTEISQRRTMIQRDEAVEENVDSQNDDIEEDVSDISRSDTANVYGSFNFENSPRSEAQSTTRSHMSSLNLSSSSSSSVHQASVGTMRSQISSATSTFNVARQIADLVERITFLEKSVMIRLGHIEGRMDKHDAKIEQLFKSVEKKSKANERKTVRAPAREPDNTPSGKRVSTQVGATTSMATIAKTCSSRIPRRRRKNRSRDFVSSKSDVSVHSIVRAKRKITPNKGGPHFANKGDKFQVLKVSGDGTLYVMNTKTWKKAHVPDSSVELSQ